MLSIIIINYKTPRLLSDCLDSVYKQTTIIPFEIIVVDNASEDNSKEIILAKFPSVKWLQLDYNAGFARANNAGIKNAAGDIVLLLNSDTVVINNAINDCYELFSASDYVACGVQLLNRDGSPQISGNYFMPGSLNNLLPLPVLGGLTRTLGNLFKIERPHVADANSVVEVDWINGAFLMVKKSVLDSAGLMDEDFFLYAEEAEWCYRIKKFGNLVIYGQFKVLHLQGKSSNTAFSSKSHGYSNLFDKKGFQIMLSNFVRIRKQNGVFWYLFQLVAYTINVIPFFFVSLFRPKRLADAGNYAVNVFKLWSYSGKILSNKPYFYKVL
jgi:GT2 family glycosyltransferase